MLGNVVFDLTFLNEVLKRHETFKDIHAQVLDSYITIIVDRPIVRENHLVRKILQYFDEIPSSKRSPVTHVPHLWRRATATLYARGRC